MVFSFSRTRGFLSPPVSCTLFCPSWMRILCSLQMNALGIGGGENAYYGCQDNKQSRCLNHSLPHHSLNLPSVSTVISTRLEYISMTWCLWMSVYFPPSFSLPSQCLLWVLFLNYLLNLFWREVSLAINVPDRETRRTRSFFFFCHHFLYFVSSRDATLFSFVFSPYHVRAKVRFIVMIVVSMTIYFLYNYYSFQSLSNTLSYQEFVQETGKRKEETVLLVLRCIRLYL